MAGRIRTIKPEMLEDKRTAALSDTAFRLFVAFILMADDYGNFRAEPLLISGTIYWATTPSHDVTQSFNDLVAAALVAKYIVRGQLYGHLSGWEKHQKISHRGNARVPGPEQEDPNDISDYGDTPETLQQDSGESSATFRPDHRSPITDHRSTNTSVPPATQPPSQPTLLPVEPARDDAREVWDHYVACWRKKNPKATRPPVLTPERRRLAKARLGTFSLDDLKRAIEGLWASDFHVENGHTSFELCLRDAKHVEQFMGKGAPRGQAPTTGRSIPTREWQDDDVSDLPSPEASAKLASAAVMAIQGAPRR